jgi:NAD(P)-dependent dehydrogenase (short-subunit alcohol dehydrogenase family)
VIPLTFFSSLPHPCCALPHLAPSNTKEPEYTKQARALTDHEGIYNASKAAVLSIGDTMRLEMHPFDVKVITLITGIIRTKFFDNMPPTRLPADSFYAPIDAQLQNFVNGGEFGKAMEYPRATSGKALVRSKCG